MWVIHIRLIAPFFKLVNLRNKDLIKYSENNINTVPGVKEIFKVKGKCIGSFIISTSYGQYIEALSDYTDFPFENTYYTSLDMRIGDEDIESELGILEEFKLFDYMVLVMKMIFKVLYDFSLKKFLK